MNSRLVAFRMQFFFGFFLTRLCVGLDDTQAVPHLRDLLGDFAIARSAVIAPSPSLSAFRSPNPSASLPIPSRETTRPWLWWFSTRSRVHPEICGDSGEAEVVSLGGEPLLMCLEPWKTNGNQAEIFRGQFRGQAVVVKFYRRVSKIGGKMETEIAFGNRLAGLPLFVRSLGKVPRDAFDEFIAKGVNLRGLVPPGAIFEFVPGESLAERIEAVRSEKGNDEIQRKERLSNWAGCIAAQMLLAHMMSISRGVFHTDLYAQNVLLEGTDGFRLSENVWCERIRVIDLGLAETVFEDEVPGKLLEAVTNFGEIYEWGNMHEEILFVTNELVEFLQDALGIDRRVFQFIVNGLREFSGNLNAELPEMHWVFEILKKLDLK